MEARKPRNPGDDMNTLEETQLYTELAIRKLACEERLWRDTAQFDKVAECFEADAYVRTTWFEGTAADYIAQSIEIAKSGRRSMHPMWPAEVKIIGDRATVESMAEIRNRNLVEGVEVDMTMECRFFSRVHRVEGRWKFTSFEGIYIKDRLQSVRPGEDLPIDWDKWSSLRPSYRSLAYIQSLRGYEVSADLLGDDRPDLLERFYRDAHQWLSGETV
jgi:hypothetical protein